MERDNQEWTPQFKSRLSEFSAQPYLQSGFSSERFLQTRTNAHGQQPQHSKKHLKNGWNFGKTIWNDVKQIYKNVKKKPPGSKHSSQRCLGKEDFIVKQAADSAKNFQQRRAMLIFGIVFAISFALIMISIYLMVQEIKLAETPIAIWGDFNRE